MRERINLRAWPLTPIHIGTGEELTPESFRLDGDQLQRFSPFGALTRATQPERELYRKLLSGGDFVGAQRHLAKLASRDPPSDDVGTAVSTDSRRDLERVLAGESIGRGGVRPMTRDGGTVILPGSSLKGALRTAWIGSRVDERQGQAAAHEIRGVQTKAAHESLTRAALEMDSGKALEQDPLRDLAVADAPIGAGLTRFDRATLGKLDRERAALNFDQTGGIQMHVERLVSLADGSAIEPIVISIDVIAAPVAAQRADHAVRARMGAPRTVITPDALWRAANRFHADLWRYERGRFYGDAAGAALDRLIAAFGLNGDADLADQLDRHGLVLQRVGRYAQFESKSVKVGGERHGLKARTVGKSGESKARLMDCGGTRTTVQLLPGLHLPFGWLMLALPGKGPAMLAPVDLASFAGAGPASGPARSPLSRSSSAAPVQATAALAAKFRFRKGERVRHPEQGEAIVARDVGVNDAKMDLDFDGEIDPVSLAGWTKA